MILFSGAKHALEKEVMMRQTIQSMVKNYLSNGQLSSRVNLSSDDSLQDSTAFKWLVDNKYFVLQGDRVAITQLAIAKLYVHFADQIGVQPLTLNPTKNND